MYSKVSHQATALCAQDTADKLPTVLQEQPGHLRLGRALHGAANFDVLELQPLRNYRTAASDIINPERSVQSAHAVSAAHQEPDQAEEASCRIQLLPAPAAELNSHITSHPKAELHTGAGDKGRDGAGGRENGAHPDDSSERRERHSEQSRVQEAAVSEQQPGSEAEEGAPLVGSDWEASCQQERQRRGLHASTRDSSSSLTGGLDVAPSKPWSLRPWPNGASTAAAYTAVQQAEAGLESSRDSGSEVHWRSKLGRAWGQLASLPWSQVRHYPAFERWELSFRCANFGLLSVAYAV